MQLALIQMERKGKNQTQTDSSGVFLCLRGPGSPTTARGSEVGLQIAGLYERERGRVLSLSRTGRHGLPLAFREHIGKGTGAPGLGPDRQNPHMDARSRDADSKTPADTVNGTVSDSGTHTS